MPTLTCTNNTIKSKLNLKIAWIRHHTPHCLFASLNCGITCLTMSLILINTGLRKLAFAICFAKSFGLQYGQKSNDEKGEFLILCPGWGGFEIKIWTNMRAMGKQNKRDFSKDRDLTTFARETAIVWVKFDFSTGRENGRNGAWVHCEIRNTEKKYAK